MEAGTKKIVMDLLRPHVDGEKIRLESEEMFDNVRKYFLLNHWNFHETEEHGVYCAENSVGGRLFFYKDTGEDV